MLTRLETVWEDIRTSLWALPFLMIAVAAVLAVFATRISIDTQGDPVWFLYSGTAKDAPDFLSNLVAAMITLATLAISITMVVLTLAAQQLGPRLIRIFMSDLRTQTMLGLFVATVVYLLLVMRSVYGDTVPNLAVTIGSALVILSVIVLLVFVHHLARSIVSDKVIEDVGIEIDASAKHLLAARADGKPGVLPAPEGDPAELRLHCEGYVQALDHAAIVRAARKAKAVIKINVKPGHLLLPGVAIGSIWPADALSEGIVRAVEHGVLVGRQRTSVQDIEFSIRQMVEVGSRALSPGVNDPYTAMAAIDRLSLSLVHIMRRQPAQTQWCDEEGLLRLLVHPAGFDGLIDASFNMLRQYGEGSAAVLIRLADRLNDLYEIGNTDQKDAICRHLEMVLRAGRRSLSEPNDLAALEDRMPRALRITSAAG
jgi:uncharacterized membrane protein